MIYELVVALFEGIFINLQVNLRLIKNIGHENRKSVGMMDNRTEEILSRFDKSWKETEQRFDDLINNYSGFDKLKPIRQFISNLRRKGDNNYFRLGTAMHTLIISRSVNFGLRLDQKHIKIEALDNKFEVIFRDGERTYREYLVSDLNDIRVTKLLKTLKDTLVD